MNFEELVEIGKVKRIKATDTEIDELLTLAERDLKTAEFASSQDWDWSFAIAYNSVLQASRALMYSKGYRPTSQETHKSTFGFAKIALGREHEALISFFDRMREKRNRTLYEISRQITETEVRQMLAKAKYYIEIIRLTIERDGIIKENL